MSGHPMPPLCADCQQPVYSGEVHRCASRVRGEHEMPRPSESPPRPVGSVPVRVSPEDAKALGFRPYRKLPVIVGAVQMPWRFEVTTLDGRMTGEPQDYLLRDIDGTLQPCKRTIFERTYEPANTES
jgi:hypothetical protein